MATNIQPDEKFIRSGNAPTRWRVERLVELTDMPLHVRLIPDDGAGTSITLAASVLDDQRQRQLHRVVG